MSAYFVQKLLFHVNTDPSVRERFYSEARDTVMDDYDITSDERELLNTLNVGALYAMGVHPQFLAPFAGRAGIAWPDYLHAMENPGPLVDKEHA